MPDDRSGAMQDIHWSSGTIGSFGRSTIGSVMVAQLCAEATRAGGIAGGL